MGPQIRLSDADRFCFTRGETRGTMKVVWLLYAAKFVVVSGGDHVAGNNPVVAKLVVRLNQVLPLSAVKKRRNRGH